MTTDELERDLRSLSQRHEEDERLRLEIWARLDRHPDARPRRRLRARRAFAAAAISAAAVALAIVALVGTSGSGGPSSADAAIIRHAVRATAGPANTIVHVKETGVQDGTEVAAEWWQQTSPPHAIRMVKGPVGQPGEGGADGVTSFQYDAHTNTIYERPASAPPTLTDPVWIVREQLANGSAQVAGTVTIDGTSLYKIGLPGGVVGYFDRTSYRPMYIDNPQRGGSVVRTRVVTFEELPATPENEKLLSVTAQHPRASVDTKPNGARIK